MSTTGGGHKSAAESLAEDLTAQYGDHIVIETVDVWKEYAPQPFDRGAEAYQLMIKAPELWRGFYELGDGVRRSKMINSSLALYARRHMERLLKHHPADIIISTFHFANSPILDTLHRQEDGTEFITVVTDLVTAPPVWFDSRTTLCITPTEAVAELARKSGIAPDKIKVVGMPVSSRFSPPNKPKKQLKTALGWDPDKPAIIVMAGGEGIGSLDQIVENLSTLNVTIAVITGKNTRLFEKLSTDEAPYNLNLKVFGFVKNIDELMKAADLIITKAGPGTIMEALNSHLPLIIYSKLSGQEDGNVSFVTDQGAGLWQPKISEMANTVKELLDEPDTLDHMSEAAARIASPGASAKIAKIIGHLLQQ
jgi:1,2-diacylglycerol 3-beta-galactosyltransferase